MSAARQPDDFKLIISFKGTSFSLGEEFARATIAEFLGRIVCPGATWETFEQSTQAVHLAAEHLARRYEVDGARLEGCFERIVERACGGVLPRGGLLFQLFASGPLSWPSRVFECETIGDPLRFLDDEDIAALPTRLAVTDALIDPRTPLYSHRELGRLLADFAAHQESAKDRLLRDGHAATAFARSPWLDVWLNKLYPIKLPLECEGPLGARSYGSPDSRYFEGRRLTVPLTHQEGSRGVSWSSGLLEEEKEHPCPIVPFEWGRRDGTFFKRCDYEAADLITDLHPDDIEWLDSIRPILHEIKNRALLELSEALSSGTAARPWDRVVAILADCLNVEQVNKLLRVDAKYLGYNALRDPAVATRTPFVPGGSSTIRERTGHFENGELVPGRTPYVPGGLSTIIELVGFVEKELEGGTLHRTREALGGLVVSDLLGRPRLAARPSDPYWGLAGGEDGERWRSALDLYAELESRETAFWGRFRRRLVESLEAEIPRIARIPVKPRHAAVIPPMLENQGRIIAREIEEGSISPESLIRRTVRRPSNDFPHLPGLRWEEVTMTFISEEEVKISARGKNKVFRFSEIEFVDRRRRDQPDRQWKLLLWMARQGGELSWADKGDARAKGGAKARIKEIRKRLKAVMHIDDDPFQPYRKVKAYKSKFKMVDSAPPQDDAEEDLADED